jgi:hypothetical protein
MGNPVCNDIPKVRFAIKFIIRNLSISEYYKKLCSETISQAAVTTDPKFIEDALRVHNELR